METLVDEEQLGKSKYNIKNINLKFLVVRQQVVHVSCSLGTAVFAGSKLPRREADHPPASNVEVENVLSCNSDPPARLREMHRDRVSFH
jgi:hypothetical protein